MSEPSITVADEVRKLLAEHGIQPISAEPVRLAYTPATSLIN